jgi:hypothetical protein
MRLGARRGVVRRAVAGLRCRVRGSVSTPKSAAWAFSAMRSAALLPFSRDHEQSGTKASEADVSRLACPRCASRAA